MIVPLNAVSTLQIKDTLKQEVICYKALFQGFVMTQRVISLTNLENRYV